MISRKWSFFKFWFMQGGIGRSLFDRFFQKKRAEKFIIIIRGVNISEEYIKLSEHI
ncbi:hypothetical protein SEEK0253_11275 [Salmonella enterica subsp. enterica serovar Kentucky str. 0253]|nr:hypothetical protein SEEK0253_11275 [Salmonella enterica subsp. enterica serovar Kentucky str. 0253]